MRLASPAAEQNDDCVPVTKKDFFLELADCLVGGWVDAIHTRSLRGVRRFGSSCAEASFILFGVVCESFPWAIRTTQFISHRATDGTLQLALFDPGDSNLIHDLNW